MKRLLTSLALIGLVNLGAQAQEITGLVTVVSEHDVPTTAEKFAAAVEEKDLILFSRIDHAAGAEKAGMSLAPTELVIFGSPKVGTALMKCGQTVAIDLPLKALIWQDGDGVVRLSYNTAGWLGERHQLAGCEQVIEKVDGALAALAAAATR